MVIYLVFALMLIITHRRIIQPWSHISHSIFLTDLVVALSQ